MDEKIGEEVIDIYPISKWKRILAFLADFFVTGIISFLIYNLFAFPSIYSLKNCQSLQNESVNSETNIVKCLEGNNLLFKDDADIFDLSYEINYTYSCYLKEYLDSTLEVSYEVFKTYYIDISHDESSFLSLYQSFGLNYFEIKSNQVYLKEDIKELLSPLLDSKDGLSKKGNEIYEELRDKFFLVGYQRMLNNIKEVDLTYNDISYKDNYSFIESFNKIFDKVVINSSLISFVAGFLINFLILPLSITNKSSISMCMMKIKNIDTDKMKLIDNSRLFLLAIYKLFSNLAILVFLPLLTIKFEYIFNLTLLLYFALLSLVIVLINAIYLLVSKEGITLFDKLTHSSLITESSLDQIYKNKGYKI